MKIVFFGPPGSGKGTQANLLADKFYIPHLSTGDILREEIFIKSEIGNKAKTYIDNGKLVPDEDLIGIINNCLKKENIQKGYLLDGFPRTIPQAEGLEVIMQNLSQNLHSAISLIADEDELVQRLINRGLRSGRSDDTPDVIRQRQKIYWDQTAPLLEYYKKRNLLKEVDALGDIPEITKRI